ncbi:MAG: T9SS type A sorting domain-containing protein [Bacteroidota bacterium]
MKRIVYIIILFSIEAGAQNLVPNPSFEIYTSCPTNYGQVSLAVPWVNPSSLASPDYFNSCGSLSVNVPKNQAGYQYARTGSAYTFVSVYATNSDYREYIQVLLADTLKVGEEYCVKFYVSTSDEFTYGADGIGVYFSDTAVSSISDVLPFTPQISNPTGNIITDTMNWTKISGSFTASGGEKYITIGNFKDKINTNVSIINSSAANGNFAGFYIDDISVMLCIDTAISVNELNDKEFKINLYPNPSNGNMQFEYSLKRNEEGVLMIYDVAGKLMSRYMLKDTDNYLNISPGQLTNGIYLYHVVINGKTVKTDKLVVIE